MVVQLYSLLGQENYIKKIERYVYLNDTVYSSSKKIYEEKDNSNLFIAKSKELINSIERNGKIESFCIDKYIYYKIFLSNKKALFIYSKSLIQEIDNLLIFEGNIKEDNTYNINWWYKKDEIDVITVPPHK